MTRKIKNYLILYSLAIKTNLKGEGKVDEGETHYSRALNHDDSERFFFFFDLLLFAKAFGFLLTFLKFGLVIIFTILSKWDNSYHF